MLCTSNELYQMEPPEGKPPELLRACLILSVFALLTGCSRGFTAQMINFIVCKMRLAHFAHNKINQASACDRDGNQI